MYCTCIYTCTVHVYIHVQYMYIYMYWLVCTCTLYMYIPAGIHTYTCTRRSKRECHPLRSLASETHVTYTEVIKTTTEGLVHVHM